MDSINEWPILSWSFYSSFIRKSLCDYAIFFVSTRRLNVSGEWYWMISACPAAGDTDTSLKNLKQYLIGKENSGVKDGRVLAHLESVIVIQAQFHIIGRSPFQLSAARSRKLVCAYFGRWLEYWWRHVPAFLSRRSSTKHKENLLYWKWERILKEVATCEICQIYLSFLPSAFAEVKDMRTTHAMTIIHTSKKAFQYLSMICRLINVPEVLWFLRTNVSTLVLVT